MPTPGDDLPRSADVGWPPPITRPPQMSREDWLDMELGQCQAKVKELEAELLNAARGVMAERERADRAEEALARLQDKKPDVVEDILTVVKEGIEGIATGIVYRLVNHR